jgi:N-acetylmuramoyl-L-alanine amidase
MKAIGLGDRGKAVADVQKRLRHLGYEVPGWEEELKSSRFGQATLEAVKAFQRTRGLRETGKVDETTWNELVEASFRLGDRFLYLRHPPFRGDDVKELQMLLNRLGFNAGREDGIFGRQTDVATRRFQHETGLPPDGIVGPTTVEALRRLRKAVGETSVAEIFESLLDEGRSGIPGKKVVLEADEGDMAAESLLLAISERLWGEGAHIMLVGGGTNPLPESGRARLANELGADLVLGVRTGGEAGIHYFGTQNYSSPRGKRLSQLLHRNLVSVLGAFPDPSPRAFPILRETRMPAVVVELPGSPRKTSELAAAMGDAVKEYFQPGSQDGGYERGGTGFL